MKRKTLERIQADELKRERKTKTVMIDNRTSIIVNVNIPDSEARDNWLLKRDENERRRSTKMDRTRNAIKKNIEL